MNTLPQNPLFTTFFDQLIVQVDPHQPHDQELLEAQRTCGRWLALRRLSLKLTSKQFAGIAGVPVEHIQQIEIGLADAHLLTERIIHNVSRMIAGRREDFDWISSVIKIALGHADAFNPETMDRVIHELDAIDRGVFEPAVSWAAETSSEPAHSKPDNYQTLEDEPEMFEILTVLAQAESYTYAIWEKVHKRARHRGVAEIGSLLERMIDKGLIEEAKEPLIDASLDSEPIQLYSITSQGRGAFNAERTRQARKAADTAAAAPAPQPNLPDAATETIN